MNAFHACRGAWPECQQLAEREGSDLACTYQATDEQKPCVAQPATNTKEETKTREQHPQNQHVPTALNTYNRKPATPSRQLDQT